VTRGNLLEDNKTLKDYRFDNKLTVMVYKKANDDTI